MATKHPKSAQTGDKGVAFVRSVISQVAALFREFNSSDVGIDAAIELLTDARESSGDFVLAQIKAGRSYIKNGQFFVRADRDHFETWSRYSVPVIGIVCDVDNNEARWVDISEFLLKKPEIVSHGPYVIEAPATNPFSVAGFPIAVIANSNVLRNALQRSRFRFDSGAKMDPLGEKLVQIFLQAGVHAKARVKVQYDGRDVEADVLALLDGHIFAFECKNSLHPCNSYELRQSYDYIVKAAAQLNRFKQAFADERFRRSILSAAGFGQPHILGLSTCIVTGNRMFYGHRENGHAVRNIFELENAILGEGIKLFGFPKDAEIPDGPKIQVRVPFRTSNKFAASDLVDYIEKDSWPELAFKAMENYDELINFGQRTLRFKHFALDIGAYRELMRNLPQAIEEDA